MANIVQLKKSSVAAKIPLTTDLSYGELALNYADGKLYYKKSDGTTIDYFPSVTSLSSVYLPLTGGTLTGNLDINGTYLNAGGKMTFAKEYSVPTATNVPIVTDGGSSTTLAVGYVYRISLTTTGTGTNTGAVYLVYQTAATTWVAKLVSRQSATSNNPSLAISTNTVVINHAHTSTYVIRAFVERFATGNTTLTSPFFFGIDGVLTHDGDAATVSYGNNLLLHSGNYNSYAPTLTGTGASGNWGINVTGSAATLTTGRTIAMTGDVTYTSGSFNGSANVTGTATLANSGVAAGTYTKITVDTKGRATSGTTLSASDIPALTLENLPDAWVKRSVKAATTANITLSAPQTVDGIALVAGDRVLVKDQTTASQNGIYIVQAAAWTRSTDADTSSEISGANVNIDQGTTNGGTVWDTDFKTTDTLGTTSMTWYRNVNTGLANSTAATIAMNGTQAAGASIYYARADHVHPVDTSRAPSVGSTSITTLGTISAGTWQGGVISSAYGGTGVNNGGRTLTLNTNSGTLTYTNASTTLTVANNASVSGTNTGDQTTITGNAGTATTLQTARAINGISFNGSADIVVPTLYDSGFTRITNPGGAVYTTSTATVTGAMVITLPVGMTNTMIRMTIKVYEYTTNKSFEIHCGSYAYNVGNTWAYNPFAYIVGNPQTDRRFNVRFGYNSAGKAVIYVGELASTWSYPQVYVTEVQLGRGGMTSTYTTGWTIGFQTTAFENVTATISNCQVGYAVSTNTANSNVLRDASGNFSAGTITAALSGNATTATTATNQSGGTVAATTGSFSGQITSTVANGTAPLVVTSTTKVNNLNVDSVDGYHVAETATVSTLAARDSTGELTATGFNSTSGIFEASNTISANYTISTGNNAMSAGPITVADGITVTVPSGSVWTII